MQTIWEKWAWLMFNKNTERKKECSHRLPAASLLNGLFRREERVCNSKWRNVSSHKFNKYACVISKNRKTDKTLQSRGAHRPHPPRLRLRLTLLFFLPEMGKAEVSLIMEASSGICGILADLLARSPELQNELIHFISTGAKNHGLPMRGPPCSTALIYVFWTWRPWDDSSCRFYLQTEELEVKQV